MYRILLLSRNDSVLGPFADAYLRAYAGGKAEVYTAGIELSKRDELVNQLLVEDAIEEIAEPQHSINDFRSVEFDFILTLDDVSEEESHHFSSHIIKYHYEYTELIPKRIPKKLKRAVFVKLRDKIKEDMQAFIDSHFQVEKAS